MVSEFSEEGMMFMAISHICVLMSAGPRLKAYNNFCLISRANICCSQKYGHNKTVLLKHPKHILKLMRKTLFEICANSLFMMSLRV